MTENKYAEEPSVDLAYPFAVESYAIATKRYDAWDLKIQTLLSLGVTLTLAIPIGGKALGFGFYSVWFALAMITFVTAIGLGLYGRLSGKLKIIDPKTLYDHFLTHTELEFKRDMILWAGRNYTANRAIIDCMHRISVIITFLFILETLWVALWVAFHP